MKEIFIVIRAMKLKLNIKFKGSKGFTLIELLLVMGLIFLIVSMVSATFLLSINTSRDTIDMTTSAIDSRLITYRISKDLRETIYIDTAAANNIIFRSNVDDDSDYELLNYYFVAVDGYYTLFRKVDEGNAHIVASKIINENIFTYYTGINMPEGGIVFPVTEEEKGDIKIVEINLSIDQTGADSARTMELRTSITLRNRIQ